MTIVVVSVLAGYLVPELDRLVSDELPFVFPGGPSGARDMLGTIAGAMISVTGLVFSITMVVVQLASSQYSPRVLGDFLANRVTQATLGIFAASFTYALTVLRSVRGESGDGGAFVPQLSVTLAFVLVLASVGMFLAFIHHITRSIQVSSIVSHLGSATVGVVDGYYLEPTALRARSLGASWQPEGSLATLTIEARQHGAIVELDHRELVDRAIDHDVTIEVLLSVGDFVAEGQPALRVWHEPGLRALDDDAIDALRGLVVVERERISNQDPALGVRKLIDIADRALSPGINDPATAVQVLDEVHRILRRAVTRADLPALVSRDGRVRLVHRPQRVEQLIDLALAEPLLYGDRSLQVPRRIEAMLHDLEQVALPAHRPAIARWRERTRAVIAAQQEP